MYFQKNKQYMVHAYKYNGWLYRSVNYPYILFEDDDVLCLYLPKEKVKIIKENEKKFFEKKKNFLSSNKNPILWYFFKNEWFNVLITLKKDVQSYYINLSSPHIVEEYAVKYIDFDLDIKINVDNKFKVLDQDEFLENSKKWNYSPEIIEKINSTKSKVIALIKKNFFINLFSMKQIDSLNQFIIEKFNEKDLKIIF